LHAQPPEESPRAAAATPQQHFLQEMPLSGQCTAAELSPAVADQQTVVLLTQQMFEGCQMGVPSTARSMPAQHVEACCCNKLLVLQGAKNKFRQVSSILVASPGHDMQQVNKAMQGSIGRYC
jgi:hypothetical protein